MKYFFSPKTDSIPPTNFGILFFLQRIKEFLILSVLGLNLAFCNKPYPWESMNPKVEDKNSTSIPHFTIVRSRGNVKIIHADRTEESGNVGVFLFEGDKLQSVDGGMVDIQQSDDSILRLFPGSVLHITSIEGNFGPNKFSLSRGRALAKVFSGNPNSKLVLLMNSLVVSAEGMEFLAEEEGGNSTIRVKFGKAIVYPRFLSLDDRDPRDVKETDPAFPVAKLVRDMILTLETMKEVTLSEKPEYYKSLDEIKKTPDMEMVIRGTKLNPGITNFNPQLIETSNSLSPVDKNLLESIYNLSLEIQKSEKEPGKIEELEAKRSSLENQLLKYNYTTQDERRSQVPIIYPDKQAPGHRNSAVTNNHSQNSSRVKNASSIFHPSRVYYGYRNPITRSISKRLTYYKRIGKYKKPTRKKFNNKDELYSYYERMEKLILNDGNYEIGTIISQDEQTIILHTEEGIKRIPSSDVQEVTYDYFHKKNP